MNNQIRVYNDRVREKQRLKKSKHYGKVPKFHRILKNRVKYLSMYEKIRFSSKKTLRQKINDRQNGIIDNYSDNAFKKKNYNNFFPANITSLIRP